MIVVLGTLMGTTGILCVVGGIAFWRNGVMTGPAGTWDMAGVFSFLLHVIFGLLVLSAVAPTSLSEERQRGSLDILAATALSTRAIVVGKWLGAFRFAVFMTVAPACLVLGMATGRSLSGITMAPGLPFEDYQVLSIGARLYGVGLIVATILAHGALIASIGLALAVWIKRQSLATAISIGLFVLVMMAWPFFVMFIFSGRGRFGQDLASASPVVACIDMLNVFAGRRYRYSGETLWWNSFWSVEVFIVAMGLLWLTVRTFDGCFDRPSGRPWQISVRTILVVILAAMIGAGSLLGGAFAWIDGVSAHKIDGPESLGNLAYSFLVAIGLVVIAVDTLMSGRRMKLTVPAEAAGTSALRLVLGRWWASFRLVLLMAVGPAILAMALSTAHWKPEYTSKSTTNASLTPIVTYELVKEHIPRIGEVGAGPRMMAAGLWVGTILIHGAAAIGVGLALTTVKKWSRVTVALGVVLILVVVLFLPCYLFLLGNPEELNAGMWNLVVASDALFCLMDSRLCFSVGDILWSVLVWDVVNVAITVGLLWWSIRAWQGYLLGLSEGRTAPEIDGEVGRPIVETVLISD